MTRPHAFDTCSTLLLAITFIIFTTVLLLKRNDLEIESLDTICDRMCHDADTGKIKSTDFVLIDIIHAACAPCPVILFYRPDERKLPEKWVRIKIWPSKTTVIYNNFTANEFRQSFQIKTRKSLTTLKGVTFFTQY